MATMIPDRLPDGVSAGERRLFSVLQNLPDNCIVYWNAKIDDRHPDFVVIIPDLGVLVIEVKGWHLKEIKEADNHTVTVFARGREQRHRHPLMQARDYLTRLWNECERHDFASNLYHADGENKGRFTFAWGHFAILSNITRSQLEADDDTLRRVFNERVVTRDELHGWETFTPDELKAVLKSFFDPWWPCQLTGLQISALRAVIYPIRNRLGSKSETAIGITDLRVLDLYQERLAASIGRGHRILYGVAGSGKTVILIARAKLLAELSKRVLVLCYNRVLATAIGVALRDYPLVSVFNFHRWGGWQFGIHWEQDESNEHYGERLLERLIQTTFDQYDAVLIDEAQDFCASWFRCAKQALKEPDDGDLLIAGDGSQIIYDVRGFTWAAVGIHAQGRTSILRWNYRNTLEIAAIASTFATDPEGLAGSRDHQAQASIIHHEGARRRGPNPTVTRRNDRLDEITEAVRLASKWIQSGILIRGKTEKLAPEDIGVLYPWRPREDLLLRLCSAFEPLGVARLTGPEPRKTLNDKGIRVTTVKSARGLQFRAVILIWADLIGSMGDSAEEDKRLLYVALTRPEDVLSIIHSQSSPYLTAIAKLID
jgi:hypothetical protein